MTKQNRKFTKETRKKCDDFLQFWLVHCCSNSAYGCQHCLKEKDCKGIYDKIHLALDNLERIKI